MCHSDGGRQDTALADIREEFQSFALDSGRCFASLFRPLDRPLGCVLIASDMYGRSPFYRALGKRLAAAGFVALLPEMFSRLWPVADGDVRSGAERMGQLDRRATIAEFAALTDWLRAEYKTAGVGVMGFCVGGSLALTLSTRTALDAMVLYYPTILRRPVSELSPFSPLDELDGVQGAILAHWGDQDEFVPPDTIAEAEATLTRLQKPHEFNILPGLGHAFLTFDPQDAAYEPAQQSWQRSLDFLRVTLGAGQSDRP